MKLNSPKLTGLPFDLYTRHYIVSKIVNNSVRSGKEALTILDLGGYAGKTSDFFEHDKTTVLDIYDSREDNYVKGDATNLAFQDSSFDLVTSFDVYEHIPRDQRQKFITESVRVSKRAVIITMPIDDEKNTTSKAEITLNKFYKSVAGKDHPWLKEHIEYGIPTDKEVQILFKKLGLSYVRIASNRIADWKLIESLNFLGTVDGNALQDAIHVNSLYNLNADTLETGLETGYRGIYIIAKNKSYLKQVEEGIRQLKEDSHPMFDIHDVALDLVIQQVASLFKTTKFQAKQIKSLSTENHKLNEDISKLQSIIGLFENSLSWKITKPIRLVKSIMRRK